MKKTLILSAFIALTATLSAAPIAIGNHAKREVGLQKEAAAYDKTYYTVTKGDTVVISRSQKTYLTGERISNWVYYVRHRVSKVGGNRFHNGVLLQGIRSWVPINAILPGTPYCAGKDTTAPAPIVEPEPEPAPVVPAPVAPAPIVEPEPEPVVPAPVAPAPIVEPEPVAPAPVAEPKQKKQHISRFTIGVRGGAASFMQKAGDAKWQMGFDALLDLQYAYYGLTAKQHQVGFLLGASAGYVQAGMQLGAINDQYTVSTTGGEVNYTILANGIKETHRCIMVEVPVMFSFVSKGGFFMNVGPRVQIPVYSRYALSFSEPDIDAYFTRERVHVHNQMITGQLSDGDHKGSFKAPTLNLLVGVELGYEWKLNNGGSLGLGAYANYGVYGLYKSTSDAQSIIAINPPSDALQPAQIDFVAAQDVYGTGMGYLDCGIKLAYHFNWLK